MKNWYEVKVKYAKTGQDGKKRLVTEPYLVDAVSFGDAEKRITEEMEKYISGEFIVKANKIANYSDIIPSNTAEKWFKSKVAFIMLDEERGIERKTNSYMLVQADTVKEAFEVTEKSLEGYVSDYEISAINETPIIEVFELEEAA